MGGGDRWRWAGLTAGSSFVARGSCCLGGGRWGERGPREKEGKEEKKKKGGRSRIRGRLASLNPRTSIGSGKVSEIKHAIHAFGVETVIFYDELSPRLGFSKKSLNLLEHIESNIETADFLFPILKYLWLGALMLAGVHS
ncbi:hypothetical protein PTKIN_Ptkin02bG0109200 [Pterospermum kingtungense]